MNVNKEKKQDFKVGLKTNKNPLLKNNLYKLSISILLHFRDKGKLKKVENL